MDIRDDTAPGALRLAFTFTGNAATYFGIWIVNLVLTILTIGIYSAWAKVRRLRYFYGNTLIGDHALDYHGPPMAILKGRLVVVAVLVTISLLNRFNPALGGLVSLGFLLVVPLGLLYSLRFNARVTSWRNVRFNFDTSPGRDYLGALGVFLVMPALAVITFGLLLPVATRLSWNFVLRRLSYGTTRFSAAIPLGSLYGALLATVLLLIGIGVVSGVLMVMSIAGGEVMQFGLGDPEAGEGDDTLATLAYTPFIIGLIATFLAFAIASTFYSALARNAVLGNTRLEGLGRLESRLSGLGMAWIVVTNTLAVILTIGLATPWAAVRSWRYRTESMGAEATGDIDEVVAADRVAGHAVGSEWADIEGFDVGF